MIALAVMTIAIASYAQHHTSTIDPTIRTMRVRYLSEAIEPSGHVQRAYLVLPETGVIDGSDKTNTLELSFDHLSHDIQQYSYEVQHCDMHWGTSSISSYDYLDGFTTADITDYERSVNTQQEYTHYSFVFPNEDMQIKASGNYRILIYPDGDRDNPVAEFGIQVVEPIVGIDAQLRHNTDIELSGRYQQLDIDIQTTALKTREAQDITLIVRQNGRLDNSVVVNRPTFVEPNRLRYINNKQLIFEGGNEFRQFDIYSTYFAGNHVEKVLYDQGQYHALIQADEVRGTEAPNTGREGTVYISDIDANGQWVLNCEKTDYPDTDAEYMWVHFCLPVQQYLINNQVFVGGDLFNNQYTADNLMQYDAENKCYYLHAYLKQGGYNYMYYAQNAQGKMSLLPLEGSHWQTQNEYTIDVYYKPFGARYDRLVGVKRR